MKQGLLEGLHTPSSRKDETVHFPCLPAPVPTEDGAGRQPPLCEREAVKKSLKASRLGGDVVEVLQRHLMTSSRGDVKTLIVWPAYDVLLPLFSQMIRNCKTLKIPLPDLLLNFFTAKGG